MPFISICYLSVVVNHSVHLLPISPEPFHFSSYLLAANIAQTVKSRMDYAGLVILIGEMTSASRILVVKFQGKKLLWKLDVDGRIILT
jgi:hypothetical protein